MLRPGKASGEMIRKGGLHTKMSSAVRLFGSDWVDMAPGDRTGGGASRNGFLERGRGGGSSKGDAGEAGEAARLRKGLLEERLMESPMGSWPDDVGRGGQSMIAMRAEPEVRVVKGQDKAKGTGGWQHMTRMMM